MVFFIRTAAESLLLFWKLSVKMYSKIVYVVLASSLIASSVAYAIGNERRVRCTGVIFRPVRQILS